MNLVLALLKLCLVWLMPASGASTSHPRTRFPSNPLVPQAQPVRIRITPTPPPQERRRR